MAYAQASPQQISQALFSAQEELQEKFPHLHWVTWANAFLAVQPNLLVEQQTTVLDEESLHNLAHHLRTLPGVTDFESIVHGPRAVYLAKKLVNCQEDAIYALADIEAEPLAYGPAVYQLVTSLAMGNSVADAVYQATQPGPWDQPGLTDPASARAGVHARVQALGRIRGALGSA